MNGQAVADAGGTALGEPGPVRVVAEMLAGRGFEVQGPVPEDERHLAVVGAARARCEIGLDNGRLFSYYFPAAGADTDPAELCGMVLRILGVDAGESARQYAYLHRGATLKGAVAREVQARGLDADLAVYEDDVFYDVVAEVILANPAKPECGAVRVTDDGTILWECDYRGLPERAAAVADTAADILAPLTTAGSGK
jgi:hypothetical protein